MPAKGEQGGNDEGRVTVSTDKIQMTRVSVFHPAEDKSTAGDCGIRRRCSSGSLCCSDSESVCSVCARGESKTKKPLSVGET